MYKVEVSPVAKNILEEYAGLCLKDNGEECALRLLDGYDEKISYLEMQPMIGCARSKNIPNKYRVLKFWTHLWFVFQIYESDKTVKIETIIDDRQNYGSFLR